MLSGFVFKKIYLPGINCNLQQEERCNNVFYRTFQLAVIVTFRQSYVVTIKTDALKGAGKVTFVAYFSAP